MNKHSAIWRLGSALHFTYQRWAHGAAGRTGVPLRYALTPSQMGNRTLAESEYSNPACTHLRGCMQEEKKREEERERDGYISFPASFASFLPLPQDECTGCEWPRNWEVWPVFPMLPQASFSTQDWSVQSLVKYWWAAHHFLLSILHCLFTSPFVKENSPAATKRCQVFAIHVKTLSGLASRFLSQVLDMFLFLSCCPSRNGYYGTEQKASDCRMKQHYNAGENKCLKTGPWLCSSDSSSTCKAWEQTCKHKGPGRGLMKQPFSNGSQKNTFKKTSPNKLAVRFPTTTVTSTLLQRGFYLRHISSFLF